MAEKDTCAICGAPVYSSIGRTFHEGTLGDLRVSVRERDAIMADAETYRGRPNQRPYNQLHAPLSAKRQQALRALPQPAQGNGGTDVAARFSLVSPEDSATT